MKLLLATARAHEQSILMLTGQVDGHGIFIVFIARVVEVVRFWSFVAKAILH